MTVTGATPWQAGVQPSLVDVLVNHGAKVDGVAEEGGPLDVPSSSGTQEQLSDWCCGRTRRQYHLRRRIGSHGRHPSHACDRYGHGQGHASDG